MNSVKVLSIFVLVIFYQQTESKIIKNDLADIKENNLEKPNALARINHDAKGLREVWTNIKESAIQSWEFIKEVAEKTRERIKSWMEGAKSYAYEVRNAFNEQLTKLEDKVQEILNDIYGSGQLMKECYEKEEETIQDLLKGIMRKMGSCFMEQIKQLVQIGGKAAEIDSLSLNDKEYINELEDKFEACEQDLTNVEECMHTVRKGVFEDVQDLENNILKTSSETRGLIDNIKNSVVTCSVNNLADASYYLSEEVMQIAKCVLDTNNKPEDDIENDETETKNEEE